MKSLQHLLLTKHALLGFPSSVLREGMPAVFFSHRNALGKHLGVFLELLDALWAHLGALWGSLGSDMASPGLSWGSPGLSWKLSEAILGFPLAPSWPTGGLKGAPRYHLEPIWELLGGGPHGQSGPN